MQDFAGKVAFITGGASGIGLSLARSCGRRGMKVMIGDIDASAMAAATRELSETGIEVATVDCDVSNIDSLQAAAEATVAQYEKVHLLANNAGVLVTGGAGEIPLDRWRWAVDVNIMGVVNGVEVFLPLLRKHGEGGHILNTASVGGHVGFAGLAAYSTTKHAVVGYSESIAGQLAPESIGVSVLCPGFVSTRIANTDRYAQGEARNSDSGFADAVESGMSPDVVAEFALQQVQAGELFIFTHPGTRQEVEDRFPQILAAFDRCEASDVIMSDPDAKRVPTKEGVEDLYR